MTMDGNFKVRFTSVGPVQSPRTLYPYNPHISIRIKVIVEVIRPTISNGTSVFTISTSEAGVKEISFDQSHTPIKLANGVFGPRLRGQTFPIQHDSEVKSLCYYIH